MGHAVMVAAEGADWLLLGKACPQAPQRMEIKEMTARGGTW